MAGHAQRPPKPPTRSHSTRTLPGRKRAEEGAETIIYSSARHSARRCVKLVASRPSPLSKLVRPEITRIPRSPHHSWWIGIEFVRSIARISTPSITNSWPPTLRRTPPLDPQSSLLAPSHPLLFPPRIFLVFGHHLCYNSICIQPYTYVSSMPRPLLPVTLHSKTAADPCLPFHTPHSLWSLCPLWLILPLRK